MRRDTISFEDFKKAWIDNPDGGYYAVHHHFQEDDDGGKFHKVVELDMICEWRLDDGKVKFIAVPFETKEQFEMIVQHLKDAAMFLNKAILKNIKELEEEYVEYEFV